MKVTFKLLVGLFLFFLFFSVGRMEFIYSQEAETSNVSDEALLGEDLADEDVDDDDEDLLDETSDPVSEEINSQNNNSENLDDLLEDDEVAIDEGDAEEDLLAEEEPAPVEKVVPQAPVQNLELVKEPAPAPAPAPAPKPLPVQVVKNEITDLKFLGAEHGGTVVIETKYPVNYTARRNARDKQLVIEMMDVRLPKRLERPFVTKEFPSSIGSINAYKPIGSERSFIVVQMKDHIYPTVQQTGNRILLAVLPKEEDVKGAMMMKKDLNDFLLSDQSFHGKKISIEVRETEIKNILDLIAAQAGVNLIVSDDVKGVTSVKLRNIPWDQALILVLQANRLGYKRQGNVLRIATLERLREEAAAVRELALQQKTSAPLVMRVVQVNYAKVEGLQKELAAFVSPRGKLSLDKRTNSILIHDTPADVRKIVKLIEALDYAPPQVLIEGKVVEAQEDFGRDIGVNWGFSGEAVSLGNNSSGAEIGLTPSLDIAPTGAAIGASGLNLNLNVGTLDLLGDLTARLAIEERSRKVKVISSPKVVTLTNEEANILQITEIPIITSTVTDGSVTKGVNFKPVQLELKVTPLVTSDNSIILDVNLSREFAGALVDQETQARPINKRTAKTKVLVRNGQTAVLGGIFQSDSTDSEQGVPYLRKIPIFGKLFEAKSKTNNRNELMVFITPRVVKEAGERL